jgi:hypothetical protein
LALPIQALLYTDEILVDDIRKADFAAAAHVAA